MAKVPDSFLSALEFSITIRLSKPLFRQPSGLRGFFVCVTISLRPGGEGVTRLSAKQLCTGSTPVRASRM